MREPTEPPGEQRCDPLIVSVKGKEVEEEQERQLESDRVL